MSDWLKREVVDGLQALLALRLTGSPAADMVVLTASIWERAFERRLGRSALEEVDAPRIRAAFDALFHRVDQWPAPSEVLDRMPPRPERPKLAAPEPTDEQHRESVNRIKQLVEKCTMDW